jgi:hypothetical protein
LFFWFAFIDDEDEDERAEFEEDDDDEQYDIGDSFLISQSYTKYSSTVMVVKNPDKLGLKKCVEINLEWLTVKCHPISDSGLS